MQAGKACGWGKEANGDRQFQVCIGVPPGAQPLASLLFRLFQNRIRIEAIGRLAISGRQNQRKKTNTEYTDLTEHTDFGPVPDLRPGLFSASPTATLGVSEGNSTLPQAELEQSDRTNPFFQRAPRCCASGPPSKRLSSSGSQPWTLSRTDSSKRKTINSSRLPDA